jgi:pimeloyl-ACP methyl ester carboxylesterase
MKWISVLVAAAVLIAVAAYFVRPMLQPRLDDSLRAAISASPEDGMPAEAQSVFLKFPLGVSHVRVADPGEGNAGVVVLVHGFSTPSYVWRDYFKPLSDAGYLVVAPDLYGRGYSDRLPGPYDENVFLGQVDAVVDHYSKGRPAHLIGYSMGGAIVARYAAKHPDKVETAGLLAPAGLGCGQSARGWRTTPLVADFLFRVLGIWLLETSLAPERTNDRDPEFWTRMLRKQAAYAGYEDSLLSTLRNFDMMDSCDAMKALKTSGKRMLAVFADNDEIIPIAHADVLAAFPGQARIVRVPGRSHGVTYAAPEAIIPEILKLISLEP